MKIIDFNNPHTYNTSVIEITQQSQSDITEIPSIIRKQNIPELVINKKIKIIKGKIDIKENELKLCIPSIKETQSFQRKYRLEDGQLKVSSTGSEVHTTVQYYGVYNVVVYLASNYHLYPIILVTLLKKQYSSDMIPHTILMIYCYK